MLLDLERAIDVTRPQQTAAVGRQHRHDHVERRAEFSEKLECDGEFEATRRVFGRKMLSYVVCLQAQGRRARRQLSSTSRKLMTPAPSTSAANVLQSARVGDERRPPPLTSLSDMSTGGRRSASRIGRNKCAFPLLCARRCPSLTWLPLGLRDEAQRVGSEQ